MLKKLLYCTDCKHPYASVDVEKGEDQSAEFGRCYKCELRRLKTQHAVKEQAKVEEVMAQLPHPNCRSSYGLNLSDEAPPEPKGPQRPAVFIHPLNGQKIYQPPFEILAGNWLPDILEYREDGQSICHWHKVVDKIGTVWYADDNGNRWQYNVEA